MKPQRDLHKSTRRRDGNFQKSAHRVAAPHICADKIFHLNIFSLNDRMGCEPEKNNRPRLGIKQFVMANYGKMPFEFDKHSMIYPIDIL
jgi:hypothetical protein